MWPIRLLVLLCGLFFWNASAFADGVLTGPASEGSGLPPGGSVADCVLNTAPGQGSWQACPGAAGGDSISVDGGAVVDPNFASTGDVDFVNTANTITANINANSVALGTDTTGNYAAGDAEAGAALTGDSATAFFSAGTIEDARLPSSMASKTITGSLNIPNSTSLPGTCTTGDIYMDTDATTGQRLYLCQSANTWALQGDGGGGGSGDVTAASTFGTDNVIVRSDGTGKGVQATGISVSDTTYDVTGAGSIGFGSNPGDAGRVRLSNGSGEGLCFELATPGTDKCLTLNTSDQLDFNGTLNLSGASTGSVVLNGSTSGSLTITTNNSTAQAITVTGAAQTTGSTTLTIPDQGGTSRNFVFDTLSQTLTNKTLTAPVISTISNTGTVTLFTSTDTVVGKATTDTFTNKTIDAEATGNVLTIPWETYYPAAGCVNTTAGSVWNLPVSNPAVAACDTGSNVQTAYMGFNDTTDQAFEGSVRLPTGHTGNIDVIVRYKAASATTGAMGWCFQMVRVATGSTSDPAYPAQASGNCVSDTVQGTAGQEDEATITSATCTSCAAGDMIYWRLSRDANGGAVTDSATGDGRVIGFVVRTRRAL